jgi:hypothetical protein
MSFRTRATVAAFFVFALVSAARGQAPVQNSTQATAQPPDTGKGKNDAITKIFNAVGSVPAVKFHVEAAKYRDEAARLREQLAQLEREDQSSAIVSAP